MQIQAAFQFCHLCQLRQPTFSPIPQKLIKFAWMKPQDSTAATKPLPLPLKMSKPHIGEERQTSDPSPKFQLQL